MTREQKLEQLHDMRLSLMPATMAVQHLQIPRGFPIPPVQQIEPTVPLRQYEECVAFQHVLNDELNRLERKIRELEEKSPRRGGGTKRSKRSKRSKTRR